MSDDSVLCIIPARGGSKGVPRKNVRLLAGKPLIAWTVEQALATKSMHVMVSTDDPEIAEIARGCGADVPFLRPAELAQDETPTEPVVEHAINWMRSQGRTPRAIMLLQATSPVRLPTTLTRALEEFDRSDYDSMVGVVPQAPFLWALDPRGGQPVASYDVAHRRRRQDMSSHDLRYRETGSLYVTKPEIYTDQHNRLGGRIGLFIMDEIEGTDIDTEQDFAMAERNLLQVTS